MTGGGAGLALLISQDGLARQLDLVAFFTDALDHNLLAFLQFVTHVADAAVSDFRNVQQSVGAGKDLNERAEIDDSIYRPDVSLADFGFRREPTDAGHGRLGGRAVSGGNRYGAIVFDVDLRAGFFDQG